MAQGDALWAQVYSFSQELQRKSPEDVTVVVEIVTQDTRRMAPVVVQSDPPWLICQLADPDDETVSEIVFIRESEILRVEIHTEHSDRKSFGFSVGQVKP